ncbi:MAG TPA: hypothetical protein VLA12_01700 [Planctomycetaceae bacterium]|nr:hypothetical protein [Planctomycetaceae bacterium]
MDFEQRLQRAIQRGQKQKEERGREQAALVMSEDELRQLHNAARLDLSDRIERGLKKIADHFPGFEYQSVMDDGWGGRISRDDFSIQRGTKANLYSRLEMVVRPFSEAHIVELKAKGTIRNKEVISRNHFQFLKDLDLETYAELIEVWLLEYAEKYSSETNL